jgi:AmmeMemoRadiSam system protein B
VFPSFILSDYFARLQIQKPTRIIVIGPNHPNLGKNWALTSKQAWDTPFGQLEPDIENINQLTQDNSNYKTQIDESVLGEEHSIGGIAPYIKYYIPEAKITPIILKSSTTKDQINYMSDLIAKIAKDKDTVVIASVDFSHYLTASQARTKDVTTLKAMQGYDNDKILTLNNDYLDSPPSIAMMLEIMQKLQTTNQELLNHTNSGDLEQDFIGQTTSYFSIGFR